ncbi:E3 SUMO-protein ligase ZBED1-like [Acanthochromis polyacanthus]|uniref:E3 SUMO-protein ligase ZBED1-like n=2 Tax=Acanthochromis polyacanthus TaxID=80966 RepID=UPI0022340232|nr:E3 SUMO-protein ligase ZBED1-like [Acanthochromis polyacanthus]
MEKNRESLLNGQFKFKILPDGALDKTKVTCIYCKGEFNYHRSNSSLLYHLKAKHPGVLKSDSGSRQTTLEQYRTRGGVNSEQTNKRITDAITCWIATNCRPVNIVEDAGLCEVIKAATGDTTYKLPARKTIMSRVEELYDNKRTEKLEALGKVPYVSLTGDHWTSFGNDNYLGVTAHFIDNDWCLQSFALTVSKTTERHYAEACAQHFEDIAQDWGIENKVTTLGTDSARNMVAAVRQLPYEHLPCTAHAIQRSICVSLSDSGIDAVLAKCRKLVGHFKHSPSNTRELNAQQVAHHQKEEPLIQDVPTRWNSTLAMIQRVLQNREPIGATLREQHSKLSMLTDQECAKLQRLSELLEPCRYVTEILGGEHYISCSVVLPAFCHLFRVMEPSEDDPVHIVKWKKLFSEDLAKRKENSNLAWLKLATALDPRFKDLKCLPKTERGDVWNSIADLLKEKEKPKAPSPETTDVPDVPAKKAKVFLLSSSDSDADEEEETNLSLINRYRSETKLEMDACPLQWWLNRKGSYGKLALLARKYLSSPATTVPCERLFSLSGHVVQKKRASLSSANVERLVCLSSWLKVKDKGKGQVG